MWWLEAKQAVRLPRQRPGEQLESIEGDTGSSLLQASAYESRVTHHHCVSVHRDIEFKEVEYEEISENAESAGVRHPLEADA